MTIPDYQTIMLPLLQLAADGEEHRLRDAIDQIGDRFGLGDEERKELLPSGRQAKLANRVGWTPPSAKGSTGYSGSRPWSRRTGRSK